MPEQSKYLGWKHFHWLKTLHSTVLMNDSEKIKDLMGESTSLKKDPDGFTPLHYASILHLHNGVSMLLDNSKAPVADIFEKDGSGLSCLHWALLQHDAYLLELLLSHLDAAEFKWGKKEN